MFNQVKLEFRRLFRSSEFYVVLGCYLLSMVATLLLTNFAGNEKIHTVTDAVARGYAGGNILLFTSILLCIFVVKEYTSGYIKNFSGMPNFRIRVVVSKLPVIALVIALFFLIEVVFDATMYPLMSAGNMAFGDPLQLAKTVGMYYLIYFAVSTAVFAIAGLTRNMTGAILISMLWPTGIIAVMYGGLELLQFKVFGSILVKFTRYFADAYIAARPDLAVGRELLFMLGMTLIYFAAWFGISLLSSKTRDVK